MNIDQDTVKKIAHLARLQFTDAEEKLMTQELSKILTWMEKLNELNTDEVEPLIHLSSEINVLREDEVRPHLDHKSALLNAPRKDSDYFRVPKVIE
ncbi:MAG: Asp-tRNA(Asn)/Glu-tRNA(Gln) amidotransferase subunit GatC [Cytophagales bacterium]|nr:Asp-tRNA(Asn)/Glu-tRNA(Gln) amidotransferase subunit GatC [Cytophagales bacterium]